MIPALVVPLSTLACEPDVTDAGRGPDAIGASVPRSAGFTSLAVVRAPGGAQVAFRRLDTGHLTVSELVPAGALSPMNALMTEQSATPLELFLAIAPAGSAVPVELEEAHFAYAAAHHIGQAPRSLSFGGAPSLRTQGPNGEYSWEYAADCDLPDDGAWFDWFWQTFDWNWHWYHRSNGYEGRSPPTPNRVAVQSHLCNDGPSGSKIHRVLRYCGGWSDYVFTNSVPPEHRSQFRVWDGPYVCSYENRNTNPIGSARYPTYSHGITTP